ncbi:PREDICTED: protein sprint-like [Wasmannia auropunctata]|uniref:protein sprint-like n=1 Tax=Wasmannia auropunctata TaxID=64793 RepID=UPI0005F081DE|nr:PREDICTED: protein sprint-like [Wasmannia auropunctata]
MHERKLLFMFIRNIYFSLQNFVVRQSSQSDTMALSVRLPAGKGPYIEHYLIQANKGKLSLETSENRFDNIPSLIAHYSQCWKRIF